MLRTLLRSAIRFERSPSVRAIGLDINIAVFDLKQADVRGHMGEKAVLESGRDLVDMFKYTLRTQPATASNLDKALKGLLLLNKAHTEIKECHRLGLPRGSAAPWRQRIRNFDSLDKTILLMIDLGADKDEAKIDGATPLNFATA